MALKKFVLVCSAMACMLIHHSTTAQDGMLSSGEVHGNVQVIAQQYNEDTLIGAQVPPAETAMNAFTNIIYTNGPFSAGFRYESYLNAQLGYPGRFKGTGLGYRFVSYAIDDLEVTAGNFYDQFGNGLIFRSYEERQLGVDNAMDGVRIAYKPYKGLYLKGVYGVQRFDFDNGLVNGDGIVRGFDGEMNLNEFFDRLDTAKTRITIGGSFVSKFQPDDNADLNLPENVGSYAGRMNLSYGKVSLGGEMAYKINDPSADNGYIFKDGKAMLVNTSFTTRGFALSLDAKYIENMSYRSDRDVILTDLMVNFLPALTKPHTYNLAATLYPYATQPNGEVAYQAELAYKFKKASKANSGLGKFLGGKYGTSITINAAAAFGMDSTTLGDVNSDITSPRLGYKANFFSRGEQLFFSDINVELKKKISKKFRFTYMFLNMAYDNDINQGAYTNSGAAVHGKIYADIHILDLSYKLAKKHNIRMEMQHMETKQHLQNWATGLIEYTYSPHWFVAVLDQYNYGNDIPEERIHYVYTTVGYIKNAHRFTVGYGKQRAGLFCVGGVCRTVPASNGFTFSITSSF